MEGVFQDVEISTFPFLSISISISISFHFLPFPSISLPFQSILLMDVLSSIREDRMKDLIVTETIIHTLLVDTGTHYMLSPMVNQLTSRNRSTLVSTILSTMDRRGPIYDKLVKIIGTVVILGMVSNRTTRKRIELETSLVITSYIIQESDQRKTAIFLRTIVKHLCLLDKLKLLNGLIFFRPSVLETIRSSMENFIWEETILNMEFYSLLCNGSLVIKEKENENGGIYYCGRDGDIDDKLRTMTVFEPNKKRKRGLKYDYQAQRWTMRNCENVRFVKRRESPNYIRLMTMLLCAKTSQSGREISQFLGNCISGFLGDVTVSCDLDVLSLRHERK
jgi:hypothetical protein